MAAAGKWKLYNVAKKYIGDGTLDLDDTTNWKLALFLSAGNANTLSLAAPIYGNLTSEHSNANGYTTGGVSLSGITFTESSGTLTFDCSDLSPGWTATGGSIVFRYGVIYKNATVNSVVKPALCVCVADTAPADVTTTTGNTLSWTMNASGVFTLSGADTD